MNNPFLFKIFAGAASLLLTIGSCLGQTDNPNIVIIYADDMGYGDIQSYNPERGKIPTPNIDLLAAQGMRFTDGHSSSAVSTPSRYSILTGRYHWRTRLQKRVMNGYGKPLIATERLTLATAWPRSAAMQQPASANGIWGW